MKIVVVVDDRTNTAAAEVTDLAPDMNPADFALQWGRVMLVAVKALRHTLAEGNVPPGHIEQIVSVMQDYARDQHVGSRETYAVVEKRGREQG